MEKWRIREPAGDTWDFPNIILRISKCGKFVETSRNAVVPIASAARLFRVCRSCRERHAGAAAENMTVGGYGVREITENGDAQIGCHFLTFEEMERCFEEAGKRGLI